MKFGMPRNYDKELWLADRQETIEALQEHVGWDSPACDVSAVVDVLGQCIACAQEPPEMAPAARLALLLQALQELPRAIARHAKEDDKNI